MTTANAIRQTIEALPEGKVFYMPICLSRLS
jgi:hypothetical protein